MRLITTVYDALRTFDRPCTRAELEAATGLGKHEVRNGLDGLRQRRLVSVSGSARERATYQLRPAAERPEDLRGRSARTEATRQRISASRRRAAVPGIMLLEPIGHGLPYRPSFPPSHVAAPGALRSTVSTLRLETHDAGLLLQQLWRKR